MIPQERRRRVERLSQEGYGARRIARVLGISRNTVREILDPGRRKRRRKKRKQETEQEERGSLLDPYKERVRELLEEDERRLRRSRREKPLTTTHLLKEIRKLGYQGGRTLLDDYVRTLRGPRRRDRRPYARFETIPAEEAQQDWTSYTLRLGRKTTTVEIFSLVLCWSRYQFLRAYLNDRQPTLLWGHAAAFSYFEGVPWRIVYDRQRTITPFDIDGEPVIHEKFQAFAEHYGFEVRICRPGDKERKGKIERPFRYFEESFLPGRSFESLEDLNRQIRDWLDGVEFPEEGNHRSHGTTNEVPYERWLEEKAHLFELPPSDLLPRRIEQRQVEKDCTFSLDGTRYTVPAGLVEKGLRKVWLSVGEEELVAHDSSGEVIARHRIDRSRKLVIAQDHYREIRRRGRTTRLPELERQLLGLFPQAKAFLDGLKATVRSIAPVHLREILALARRYRREDVAAALERAVRDGTTTAGYVRRLLECHHPTGHLGHIETEIPRGLELGQVDPGSAEGYGGIFDPQDCDPRNETEDER